MNIEIFDDVYRAIKPALVTDLAQAVTAITSEALRVGSGRAVSFLRTFAADAQPQPDALPKPPAQPAQTAEEVIWELLQTPQHIDELHTKTAIPVGLLSALLLQMEFGGKIKKRPGDIFARA